MISFAIEADNDGFNSGGVSIFEEGFEALRENLSILSILLDGLFFEKKGQEAGTEENRDGMGDAKINET
jgi:hypothetical protein